MKQVLDIVKKEVREYISSPVAYIVIGVFSLLVGAYFSRYVFVDNQANLRKLFEFIPLIWIVFIPALTMKSFSEELKTGTLEVLMTLPVSKTQIVIGKYLSNLVIVLLMLILTTPAIFTINYLGNPDIGQTVVAYFGLVLLASAYIFIGLAVSIKSRNQIVAFILSAFIIAILYGIGEVQILTIIPARYRDYFELLGMGAHFRSIARGVLDSRDLIYYLTILVVSYYSTLNSFQKIQSKGK